VWGRVRKRWGKETRPRMVAEGEETKGGTGERKAMDTGGREKEDQFVAVRGGVEETMGKKRQGLAWGGKVEGKGGRGERLIEWQKPRKGRPKGPPSIRGSGGCTRGESREGEEGGGGRAGKIRRVSGGIGERRGGGGLGGGWGVLGCGGWGGWGPLGRENQKIEIWKNEKKITNREGARLGTQPEWIKKREKGGVGGVEPNMVGRTGSNGRKGPVTGDSNGLTREAGCVGGTHRIARAVGVGGLVRGAIE